MTCYYLTLMYDDEEVLIVHRCPPVETGLQRLGPEDLVQLKVLGVRDAADLGQHVHAVLYRIGIKLFLDKYDG